MKYLIKNCTILHRDSDYHKKKVDILIRNGKIEAIGKNLTDERATVVKARNLFVSVGWMDIGTHLGEPGLEHRETLDSLCEAALRGGYTDLAPLPTTVPPIQTKSQVQNIIQEGKDRGISIRPLGLATVDGKGGDLTEYMDLANAGANGFTDGLKAIANSGNLMRALQYTKAVDAIVLHHPNDASLANDNLVDEGEMSIEMGVKGSPAIAETMMVERDLALIEYANAKMAFHLPSTSHSIKKISDAKKGQSVYVGISYLNLTENSSALEGFKNQFKVKPVLRSASHQRALLRYLNRGEIDYIASNHRGIEIEGKKLEFPYANHGATGLETVFAALNTILGDKMDLELAIEALTTGPRKVLGVKVPQLEIGKKAKLTAFSTSQKWSFDSTRSLNQNNPYLGQEFNGQVVATFNGKTSYINL